MYDWSLAGLFLMTCFVAFGVNASVTGDRQRRVQSILRQLRGQGRVNQHRAARSNPPLLRQTGGGHGSGGSFSGGAALCGDVPA